MSGSIKVRKNSSAPGTDVVSGYTRVRYYGEELIGNGTFDNDTGWTLSTGVTISGGVLNYTPTINNFTTYTAGSNLVIGHIYLAVFDLLSTVTDSSLRLTIGGWGLNTITQGTTPQTITQIMYPVNGTGKFGFYNLAQCIIDNLSIREIL